MIKRLGLKRSSSSRPDYQEPMPIAKPLPAPKKSSSQTAALHSSTIVSERQVLPPDVLFELRKACAFILKETGPSDEDYATILNQPDPLEVFQKEQRDIRDVREAASASQTSLPSLFHSSNSKKRDSKHLREDPKAANRSSKHREPSERNSKSSKHRSFVPPKELARKPLPAVAKDPLEKIPTKREEEPLAPVHTTRSGPKPARESAPTNHKSALESLRVHINSRPKTSAVVAGLDCSDLPAEKRRDSRRFRPGTEELRVPSGASHGSRAPIPADEEQKEPAGDHDYHQERREMIAQEIEAGRQREKRISSVNPDYTHIPTLNPTVYRPPQPYQPVRDYSRPQSRASEIIENIREGIRDYVKPRPSLASTRYQSRTVSRADSRAESRAGSRSSSRPPSRGSFTATGRNWLKGAANGLRRKNSWNSFRSNVDDEDEKERGRNKGPDLNRSLPPLPGLDQYKEPKVHIAHLLARGPAPPPINTNLSSPSVNQHGFTDSPKTAQPRSGEHAPTPPTKTSAGFQTEPKSHSPVISAPHPGSAQHPGSATMSATEQHTSPLSGPPRSMSEGSQVPRLPFADDNDSAQASRVVSSMEPNFIDMEVKRRLQGKVSSPVSPVDTATTSQLFTNAASLPPPPPEHEHPAYAKESPTNHTDTAVIEQATPVQLSPREERDKANSFRSQSDPRIGALGVERRPTVVKQQHSSNSTSFTRGAERRAASALGFNENERLRERTEIVGNGERRTRSRDGDPYHAAVQQIFVPSQKPARESELPPPPPRDDSMDISRELAGAGALVGLENHRSQSQKPSRLPGARPEDRDRMERAMAYDRERERQRAMAIMSAQESSRMGKRGTETEPMMSNYGTVKPRRGLRNRLSRLLGGNTGEGQRVVPVN